MCVVFCIGGVSCEDWSGTTSAAVRLWQWRGYGSGVSADRTASIERRQSAWLSRWDERAVPVRRIATGEDTICANIELLA